MSNFCEEIKKIILKEKISMVQVCKIADIDRTYAQKMISGSKTPKMDFLEKFLDAAQLTSSQKNLLMGLYNIHVVGEDIVNARKIIVQMFNNLSVLEKGNGSSAKPNFVLNEELSKSETLVCNSKIEMNFYLYQWLLDMIINEDEVNLYVPFEFKEFFNTIFSLCAKLENSAKLNHILFFENNKEPSNYNFKNLQTFSQALPFALSADTKYSAYYNYCNTASIEDFNVLYPYYCVCNSAVILISQNFDSIVLQKNKKFVDTFIAHFKAAKKQSKEFITSKSSMESILQLYTENESLNNFQNIYAFESQPSYCKFFNAHYINKYLNNDLPEREILLASLTSFISKADLSQDFNSYFSKAHLIDFVKTGVFDYFPKGLMSPLSYEDRILFLQHTKEGVLQENRKSYMLKDDLINAPQNMSCGVYNNQTILFSQNYSTGLYLVKVSERTIYNSFIDFFDSLKFSEYVYSKEETLETFEKCFEYLRNKILEDK